MGSTVEPATFYGCGFFILYLIINKFIFDTTPDGWVSILSSIFFFGGLTILFLGLIMLLKWIHWQVCWKTKYIYYNPRPSQLDSRIKTLTGLPNFPAYISGHSTFSGAAATVLGYLVPNRAAAYTKMANDASKSRLVGGLHYRSDCEAGLQVGNKIGQYAINKGMLDGSN